jgi:hypothetical protein
MLASFRGGGLVPVAVWHAELLPAEVTLITEHDQAADGEFPDDAPGPGCGRIVDGTGQWLVHPPDPAVRAADDLQASTVSKAINNE